MKLGLVDLDTSHPQSWIPILREMGHDIVGLCDHGDIHPDGYADTFAKEHNVPKVYGHVADMVDDVDGVIIHSCAWDSHIVRAEPFVEAGKAVLIDKPLAGNTQDLARIRAWIENGARLTGGSSLRFCAEVREFLACDVVERGEVATAICGCGVDEFNYGIHAYATLAAVFDEPAESVQYLGGGAHHRVAVRFAGDRMGIVVVGDRATKWIPFYVTIATTLSVTPITVDNTKIYRSLLEQAMPYLAGETDEAPLSVDALLRPEQWAIAAARSASEGGRPVRIDELTESDGYTDPAFVASYRKLHYPEG